MEVPADFIKNRSTENLTGLTQWSLLNARAYAILYISTFLANHLDYILHKGGEMGFLLNGASLIERKKLANMFLVMRHHL